MKFADTIRRDFTTSVLVLIPLCIGLNIVGQFFTQSLRLPLWLNVQGTMIAGVLGGPWVGLVTGLLTNVVAAFTIEGPTALFFAVINATYGVVSGILATYGWYRDVWRAGLAGFIGELVSTPIGAPIVVLVFGGITTGSSSAVTAFLMAAGQNIWNAVILGSIFIDGADKVLSSVIAYFIIRAMARRTIARFSRGAANLGLRPAAQARAS
ncbi:MAG TPA: ECF transporter S component [Candidatus Limnocylindria bacterium]|jgi:energy-coupling factor transport system substrate-specific component|nr:ECF transporter S component [Candidatus Limnocylindria bacterium]